MIHRASPAAVQIVELTLKRGILYVKTGRETRGSVLAGCYLESGLGYGRDSGFGTEKPKENVTGKRKTLLIRHKRMGILVDRVKG
jgi:hypothetical protein